MTDHTACQCETELLREQARLALEDRGRLRKALGEIWGTLINQQCQAGGMAWRIADDALDQATKDRIIAAALADE